MPKGVYPRTCDPEKRAARMKRSADRAARYHRENKENDRLLKISKRYGISVEDYLCLSFVTGGDCIICDKPCPTGRRLAVDHDHKTGIVRGLLCVNCNRGIGRFKDQPALLREAANYLEFFERGGSECQT